MRQDGTCVASNDDGKKAYYTNFNSFANMSSTSSVNIPQMIAKAQVSSSNQQLPQQMEVKSKQEAFVEDLDRDS